MEIAVLSPRNQFVLQYENQSRRQYTVNNPEARRRDVEAANAPFNGQMFKDKMSHNQPAPVSYRILPSPSNTQQFPPVNNLRFINGSATHYPCGNNSQVCSVNGVHASPVPGFQNWPPWPFSSPSPECEIPKNTVAFRLSQHPLLPYHSSPSPAPTSSALHPHISCFSAGSDAMHVGRRWHSMPEEGVLSNQNDIIKGGKGAPLFRSWSASIPSSPSPEERYRQPCPPIAASPKVAEIAPDDYKKTRPWKDKRSPKPNFEWKLVDSGPQNEVRFGPEKQTLIAPQKANNQKRITVKKATDSAKNGEGRNKNTRDVPSSKDTKDVPHVQKNEGETDMDVASSGHHQALSGSPSKSPRGGISNLPQKERSNFDASMDHYGRHKKVCDNEFRMHRECGTDERIVFKPDIQGNGENKAKKNLGSITPDFYSKDSSQNSQTGHSFSKVALENSLVPEGELFIGSIGSCGTDDIGKEVCAAAPNLYATENWAGPAYTNSPSPRSLPVPRFSMREMRSASLDLPPSPANNELNEGSLPSSHSAPPSPTRDAQQCSLLLPSRQNLQGRGLSLDADFATKDLRRILNLS
ncbi:hypothetical protein SUGI_0148280 [Cryptomeria japonica]|nr:hypothetical protein SUGI_0148280 [Cryptomeria japonica]